LSASADVPALEPHDIGKLTTIEQWLPQRLRAHGAFHAILLVPEQAAPFVWGHGRTCQHS
jgi:hypothetical protein